MPQQLDDAAGRQDQQRRDDQNRQQQPPQALDAPGVALFDRFIGNMQRLGNLGQRHAAVVFHADDLPVRFAELGDGVLDIHGLLQLCRHIEVIRDALRSLLRQRKVLFLLPVPGNGPVPGNSADPQGKAALLRVEFRAVEVDLGEGVIDALLHVLRVG